MTINNFSSPGPRFLPEVVPVEDVIEEAQHVNEPSESELAKESQATLNLNSPEVEDAIEALKVRDE